MKEELKNFWDYVSVAVVALVMFVGFVFLYRLLDLPSREEIINWAQNYYAMHGYWVVLVGALVEGALFINWYLPGSVVVVMGVVFSSQNDLNPVLVVAIIMLGFFVTSIFNYFMGRFGWYHVFMKWGLKQPLERVRLKIKDKGLKIIFTTYFHPNMGALTATSAGVLKFSFKKFVLYSLVALIFWNTIWGILVYLIGPAILKYLSIWMIFAIGAIYLVYSSIQSKRGRGNKVKIP